jgi:hypothetical protein
MPRLEKEEQAMTVKSSMDIRQDENYLEMLDKLEKWVNSLPERARTAPIGGFADGSRELSPQDILDEVRNLTDFGKSYLENWIELNADE